MKQQNLPHLDKLKQNLSKIFTLIFIVYITFIISLYKCYNDKVEMEKVQVLQTQYNKIVEVSMHKLTSLSHRLSSSIEESNISINSNSSEIEICNEALKCTNCSLFRFGELLDRNIPEFIYYNRLLSKLDNDVEWCYKYLI